MIRPESPILSAHLIRRVHPGLSLDARIDLGGECGVLFGASGAGKSTILRMLAGLSRPDAGFVRLGETTLFDAGKNVDVPLRSRRIGLIFQDDLLFPHLSVARNVGFGLKGRGRAEIARRVAEVAELCGVGRLLDRRPGSLSGGERQRVGLARALAPRPRLLLCDEPVSALDLDGRHALIARLRAVREAEAIPLLYVTHQPAEAIALGNRLFLLSGGKIVADGAPLDVLASRNADSRTHFEGVRNVFGVVVEGHAGDGGESRVRIEGGPALVVPYNGRPVGSRLSLVVHAEDILLATGPIGVLSARNVIEGAVERAITHGAEAEVLVRTGAATWIVGVVSPAVDALGMGPGVPVRLVIKARSCRILDL